MSKRWNRRAEEDTRAGDGCSITSRATAILLCGIGATGKSTTADHIAAVLREEGSYPSLIRFDGLRRSLAPAGTDPFSRDRDIKTVIYARAAEYFLERVRHGDFLIIDSGLSVETIREQLKERIPGLRVVHIYCPRWMAVLRDTIRSLKSSDHERGAFLYLRAYSDLLNPFKKNKFQQPGVTYLFEYPECADLHVSTLRKRPREVAREILEKLRIVTST
jgi:adenylylsulfate kinase-like enzyme